ncbi:MAG TPA: hypothetical protein VKV21_06170 [Solirubrobacteraceae bacterium]|nr:hypothetical protein [Solirubrobacteraceae bacterium]
MDACSTAPRGRARAAAALVLLLAAAVAITLAAGTRPSFDAYGWLDWGRMTLHGGLDTNAAPSWKPLPWVFTVVFGLFGRGPELWLWMLTVTFVSLVGLACAGRLASALAGAAAPDRDAAKVPHAERRKPPPPRPGVATTAPRVPSVVAAVLAVAGLLAVHDQYPFGYLHYVLSAQSDPMVVAFVLGAAVCRLDARPGAAFALLLLAALGRPEAWPFLLAAGAWLWRERPAVRWLVLGGGAAVALLWFGIPALTSRSWLVAADNADASGYAPHGAALHRAVAVLARLVFQVPWGMWAAAGAAVALAAWRRERFALGLAAGVLVWVAVEVGFGIHGWPALGRYMFEPSAIVVVLGASFVGRLLGASLGGRLLGASTLLAATLIAWTTPAFVDAARREAHDLQAQHARTAQLDALARTIDRLGGPARLRRCGEMISAGSAPGTNRHPSIGLGGQTPLAFDVGVNVNRVGYIYPQRGHPRNPIVVFHPHARDSGWTVRALRQATPACRRLTTGR